MPCKSITCLFIQNSLVKLIKATGQSSCVPAVLFRLAVSIPERICVDIHSPMHMHGYTHVHVFAMLLAQAELT